MHFTNGQRGMDRGLTVILVLVVLAPGASAASGSPTETLGHASCNLEMQGHFTQGQPVVMRLMLQNDSQEEEVFDLGYNREGAFQFKLRRDEGDWIDLPQKQAREGLSLPSRVTIPLQDRYTQQIILDDWYKFSEPGKYVVVLTIPKSPGCAALELQFEITPLDVESLTKVCRELVDTIRQNRNDYAKSADAANVLARVDNPLVTPFLMKSLEANPAVDWIVIPAIERIGDKQAVHSLISLLEKPPSKSAQDELVRPALMRLEKRSAPEDAESIRIALARFPIK